MLVQAKEIFLHLHSVMLGLVDAENESYIRVRNISLEGTVEKDFLQMRALLTTSFITSCSIQKAFHCALSCAVLLFIGGSSAQVISLTTESLNGYRWLWGNFTNPAAYIRIIYNYVP